MTILTSANEIVANVSHKLTEYSAIYPITPSSGMGEKYSSLSQDKINSKNIFGTTPKVDVMQSEAGAIASCFGALYGGTYSTTFTSSQGLLLMIPNMYKLASSLKPFVLNVASRSLSTHALNIFCDHSDVYSTLSTGFSILCSSNVQKAQDFCMISHMLTLKSKIPVLHFFDGFTTSHKLESIVKLKNEEKLFPKKEFIEFKNSSLVCSNPKTYGTNQNSDIYFQNRERIEESVRKVPKILNKCFEEFYKIEGRKYQIFEYFGSKKATKIVISIASSVETLKTTLDYLDDSYGVVGVNLLNPFCVDELLKVLPKTTKVITVLDRTKQAGHNYEYLGQTIKSSLANKDIKILCGRYGLGGKDFDKACAKSVFLNMDSHCLDHFTVGIDDDISNTSLEVLNEEFKDNLIKYAFFGIGNDGTVSAGKFYAKKLCSLEGDIFVSENSYYDSKKSGNLTESQIFAGKKNFQINYKEKNFDAISISNLEILNSYDILKNLKQNSTILINSTEDEIEQISDYCKNLIASKNCKLYLISASQIAKENNLGDKINLIMMISFFIASYNKSDKSNKLSQLVNETSVEFLKQRNSCDYLIKTQNYVKEYHYPESWLSQTTPPVFTDLSNCKVSYFNANGETKNLNNFHILNNKKACWLQEKCIKCTNCAQICPHGAILIKKVETKNLTNAPKDFKYLKNNDGTSFCLFVDTENCTGCGNCISICPTQALFLKNYSNTNKEYFYNLLPLSDDRQSKNLSLCQNYYSCNSSCSGCQEIMYYKILGSLFGSHLNLINATGCSSIYNGITNCSPFNTNNKGYGTSFVSNLFEDNAEFGYGATVGNDLARQNYIKKINENFDKFSDLFKDNFKEFLKNTNNFEICQNIYEQLKEVKPKNAYDEEIKQNLEFVLPMTSFIVGGDGWAYDIDFGGLDHVVSLNKNVNILILDNELYANTGGQTSKATNLGAKTKYTNEKQTLKKDLFLSLFQYKNLYFAKVNYSFNKNHCLQAFKDAVSHNGPSIILAYTPCVNHKIDMQNSFKQASLATKSGYFNLITYYDQKLELDSTPNFDLLEKFILSEGRYKQISKESLDYLVKSKKEEYEFYKKLTEILK